MTYQIYSFVPAIFDYLMSLICYCHPQCIHFIYIYTYIHRFIHLLWCLIPVISSRIERWHRHAWSRCFKPVCGAWFVIRTESRQSYRQEGMSLNFWSVCMFLKRIWNTAISIDYVGQSKMIWHGGSDQTRITGGEPWNIIIVFVNVYPIQRRLMATSSTQYH